MPTETPAHGLAAEIISMIRAELEAALAALKALPATDDGRRVTAVAVLVEEVLPEFIGQGLKPWRAVPWLDCSCHLLQHMTAADTRSAREHVSAARDLLAREAVAVLRNRSR
jgi:hypothetical protein